MSDAALAEQAFRPGSPWVQTRYSGAVDLMAPTPDQINLDAMAWQLARIPRFLAAGRELVSVAEHSCRVGRRARELMLETGVDEKHADLVAAYALLHDGHEYAMGDIAAPVKRALIAHANESAGILAGETVRRALGSLRDRLDRAIHRRAGLPYPLPPDIKTLVDKLDIESQRGERDVTLDPPPCPWSATVEDAVPWWPRLKPWAAPFAEEMFRTDARRLCPGWGWR